MTMPNRQPKGIPVGGQFATASRAECSHIDLFAHLGIEIDADALAVAEAEVAEHQAARRLADRARHAVAVGDTVTSGAGTWQVINFRPDGRATLLLTEAKALTPAGHLAHVPAHLPDFTAETYTPEEATAQAAATGVPVPVLTEHSGPSVSASGRFGSRAMGETHTQQRTWATGDPEQPFCTVTVMHATTATTAGASPAWTTLRRTAARELETSRPELLRYRSDMVVETAYHRDPEDPTGAGYLGGGTTVSTVMAFNEGAALEDVEKAVARHSRLVDWREHAPRPLPPQPAGKTYDHEARPDDDNEAGDRCKDCGEDVTWLGPSTYDWIHADDPRNA